MASSITRRPGSLRDAATNDAEEIRKLERWQALTRRRVERLESDYLELGTRLRLLFRELGAIDRRLRPLMRAEEEVPPLVDSLLEELESRGQ